MCQQNLPKLWCRYEFIVHNHLWNSEIVPQWIQQKISKKVTETDSQKRLSNSKTVNNNYLRQPFDYQRACELKLPRLRLITRSQLRCFLQNVMTIHFRDWFFSFQHKGKISYRKHVHHNPCSKYASRCWEKREWLHVLWDNWNYFLKFVRIEQKAWKHSAERYCD